MDERLVPGINGWTGTLAWDATGTTDALAVRAALPVREGSTHPQTAILKCTTLELTRNRGPFMWLATAQFEQVQVSQGGGSEDPLQRPTRIRWRKGNITRHIERDWNGKPIINSTKQPFSQPSSDVTNTLFLTVTRWEPYFAVGQSLQYENRLNQNNMSLAGVGSVGKGQMLCTQIIAPDEFDSSVNGLAGSALRIEYNWELRGGSGFMGPDGYHDGFSDRKLDQGTRGFYDDSGLKMGPFCTSGSDPRILSDPVLLNGQGKPLDNLVKVLGEDGTAKTPVQVGVPDGAALDVTPDGVFVVRRLKLAANFVSLGL